MPLIIGERDLLRHLAGDRTASALMDVLPGPTLIIPARENISNILQREPIPWQSEYPANPLLSASHKAHFPITATSANLSGLPPARDIETVLRYFGDGIDLIIDAGPTPGGLPSTIVDARGAALKVLREGVIGKKSLKGL
jgi:L-threonylcarbamoyladenylate synthase